MLSKDLHRKIFLTGLVFIAIGLPLSRFLLSVGQLLLAANWLLEGDFTRKKQKLKAHGYSVAVFLLVYLVHVIWLWNTSDFGEGFLDLRIKLPLLALPLIIGTSEPVSQKQLKVILYFLIAAVFAGTMASMFRYVKFYNDASFDMRNLSVFISHIRFSLLINMAIFIACYYLFYERRRMKKPEKVLLPASILWFMIFLVILHTLTGIVIFVAVSSILLIGGLWLHKKLRIAGALVTIVIPLGLFLYLNSIAQLLKEPEEGFANLESESANGNPYYNDTTKLFVENNHYIWVHIAEKELQEAWDKRSHLDYKGQDLRNQSLKHTLIRYLTSKGLTKDSTGVWSLTEKDIRNIEGSMSNYLFAEKSGVFKRLYQFFWEMDIYRKGGDPSGHTILQRIEYLKAAFMIIRENFWFGVGTGDVKDVFTEAYIKSNTKLAEAYWHRAHNQYVTTLLTFGIMGWIMLWTAFIYPVVIMKKWNDHLAFVFLIIAMLSMINEDTIETHVGVSFVAFFYALFMFGKQTEEA